MTNPHGLNLRIHETGAEAAHEAAERIIALNRPGLRLGVATGSTPLGIYQRLREAHREGRFSLADASAWALDEYVGLDPDHPETYRNVLLRELVAQHATGLSAEALHTPDGTASDPNAAAAAYDLALGDGVDVQILGVGANGHIGFNEPFSEADSRVRVMALTEQTRNDNARFFGGNISAVPELCITQGLANILAAKEVLLLAFGAQKAAAVAALLEGTKTSQWPVTALQEHPNVTVYLDSHATSKLSDWSGACGSV